MHLLAAYLPDQGVVLLQMEVGSKENEISAAPRLLKSIDLQGKIVTGDAMFAQRELSRQVVEAGGDYVWTVKDNQAHLRSEIETLFEIEEGKTKLKEMKSLNPATACSIEKHHGRIEHRKITTSSMMAGEMDWPYLEQVYKIEREVEIVSTGKKRSETSYGITSLTKKEADAERMLQVVRKHWQVENGVTLPKR